MRAHSLKTALATAALAVACSLPTDGDGPVANVAGIWDFQGTQETPALTLQGTLTLSQTRDELSGTMNWTEEDGFGNVNVRGGAVVGVVLGLEDVDFDVTQAGDDRRHLARIVDDTLMEGVWASLNSTQSGAFRAVRRGAP